MTQILALLTHDYVLVAADRRLTFANGPNTGQVFHDDTCKVVSLCGVWGIAYSGFATLQGQATHEWIAVRLAERACNSPHAAAKILADCAENALRAAPFPLEQTFLIAGWTPSADHKSLQPHFLLVTNMFDFNGQPRSIPDARFAGFERRLKIDEQYAARVVGQPLPSGRGKKLDRLVRKAVANRTSAKPVMQALVKEIANTSATQRRVGKNVLAFSIPRAAAERAYKGGRRVIVANEPDRNNAVFCYFAPGYSQLRQYGPTLVCGEMAVSNFTAESDPSRDFQAASIKLLHLPKRRDTK